MSSSHDSEWGPRPLCRLTCARTGSVEFVAAVSEFVVAVGEFVVAITVMPPRAPDCSMLLLSVGALACVLSHFKLQIFRSRTWQA